MDRHELDKYMIRFRAGDESAFEVIYNETQRGLFSFVLSICKNYHTAEDMLQNTYIKMRAGIAGYEPGSNALAWLFTIAKNLTLNELQKRKKEVYTDFDLGSLENEKKFEGEPVSSPLLDIIMDNLSPSEAQIVLLHLVSGYKHREIADMTKKPLGTVLWSYRNAVGKLKKIIEKEDAR
ncbi:MAG TPA: RNA polymerase sigma factor [Clostridia bacterium]|nr:RNA polymerase sigma factor [Clostridia bacterium]HRU83787.1 RNA polymerase sigma factor [Eubacteriales bacterium]